jgi:hypothetical protein
LGGFYQKFLFLFFLVFSKNNFIFQRLVNNINFKDKLKLAESRRRNSHKIISQSTRESREWLTPEASSSGRALTAFFRLDWWCSLRRY